MASASLDAAVVETRWRALGASAIGVDHEMVGKPNQDAYAIVPTGAGVTLIVADGAGSRKFAGEGAREVVRVLAEAARGWGEIELPTFEPRLRSAMEQGRAALAALAEKAGCPIGKFACTAILSFVTRDWAVSAHVGDGAVVLVGADGSLITLSPPEPSEHINETSFLSMADGLERVRCFSHEGPIAAAIAFSDGLMLRLLSYPDWLPHEPFFSPFVRAITGYATDDDATAALEAFLRSDLVRSESGDDLTLLVATRHG